ncbi:MAG: hypothetical protein LBI69_01655 [Puniceicoccales bacterium]|jgi:Tfp pilus assembly protein PilN|nr:hypothetical protein [Puniceicoccales bacterium]
MGLYQLFQRHIICRGKCRQAVIVISPWQLIGAIVDVCGEEIIFKYLGTHELSCETRRQWDESLAEGLAKLPKIFRHHSCKLIFPQINPIVKCVSHCNVAPAFRRDMIAETLEMELPICCKNFSWDYTSFECSSMAKESFAYVFAEKTESLAPYLDLIASMRILPTDGMLPFSIDLAVALCNCGKRDDYSLQLFIDRETTAMVFNGGKQPYMRYLNFGWNCALEKDPVPKADEKVLRGALRSWLLEESLGEEDLAQWASAAIGELCAKLNKEIEETNFYYIHNFQGKHFKTLGIYSAIGPANRLGEILAKEQKATFSSGRIERPVSIKSHYASIRDGIDDLSWIHLTEGAFMLAKERPDGALPFIPSELIRRRIYSQNIAVAIVGICLIASILLFGIAYRKTQNVLMAREVNGLQGQKIEQIAFSQQMARLEESRKHLASGLSRFQCAKQQQGFWLEFFNDLQRALDSVSGGWIDDLSYVPQKENGQAIEVTIAGHLFPGDENGNLTETARRLDALMEHLRASSRVRGIDDLTIDVDPTFVQSFRCKLTLIPYQS